MSEILDELQEKVNLCSFNDENELEDFVKLRNDIDNILNSQIKVEDGLTFSQMVKNHTNVIKKRASDKRITCGDNLLDSVIPNPQAGIVSIVGYSGSMKSTYVHHLCQLRIIKKLPTVLFNTELSDEGIMDSITPIMIKENISDIMGMYNDDEHIDYETILDKYKQLEMKYKDMNNFLYYPKHHVSIEEFKEFCKYARKKFNLKKDDLLFAFVDIMTMIEEFNKGTNRTDAIKLGMDALNEFVLEENIILFGTAQLNRPKTVHIKSEEDIDKFRMSASDIKDSAEIENRSRLLLGIFNRKNIVDKNPCDPIIKELTEPILDLTVLKNTYTNTLGERIYYLISSEYKSLIPYPNYVEDNKVE